jgi:dimethylargininase
MLAIVRDVAPTLAQCQLTHLPRQPLDFERTAAEHRAYVDRLAAIGCQIVQLPAASEYPDSVFVEDTAVVLDELAILARPGAESRRGETTSIAAALSAWRHVFEIHPPGTLEGGDVLVLDRTIVVGLSSRTNSAGAAQLAVLVRPHGYTIRTLAVRGCLHLKTAVTQVNERTLLINPDWLDASEFAGWKIIETHPAEPYAANSLRVGSTLLYPARFVQTRARLAECDVDIHGLDMSEMAKAEAGVTCCSLIFRAHRNPKPAGRGGRERGALSKPDA